MCWKCTVHKRAGFTQLLKRVVKEYCLLDVLMGLGKGGREGGDDRLCSGLGCVEVYILKGDFKLPFSF